MKAAEQYRASRQTDQDRIDALINWYIANKPDAGQRIEVELTASALGKFAVELKNGDFLYRGRTLVPVKVKQPSVKVWNKEHQSDIQ